jgi:sodium-dependent dicarboxylate transporter 2/3/5
MKTIGVFLFTVSWWLAVGVGFPSLVCIALLAATGVMASKEVFALSWGSYLILFVIGALGLAECLRRTGFSSRFALWFLSRPFTVGHPWIMVSTFVLTCTLMGAFMPTTAVCVIFMAIAEPMLLALGYKKGDKFAAMLMMAIGWISITAMVMTPIGHGSNLVLIEWVKRDFGYSIGFTKWLAIGIPTGVMYSLIVLAYFRLVVRPDVSRFGAEAAKYIRQERSKMGAMKLEERLAIAVFLIVALFWLMPDVGQGLLPGVSEYVGDLGFAVPPLIGAGVLCVLRVKGKPLLTFPQWMNGVPWSTVALIGAIMALRTALGKPETGIPELLNSFFQPLAIGAPFSLYRLIGQLWAITQTQFMSNFVTVTLVYTAMMPAAVNAGLGNPVALAFSMWYGARAALALPSATSTTAMVTGSGWVPVSFMARYGFPLIIPMALFFAFVCYPLATLIFR